ncbi:desiccation-related protein PCC13-62-like [Hibiscus syriacus]|uniref:desiccation-related protein PCC13-62-like n=1 Tax=Hibiscus syriacus TaxID=106335 RepID=UPI00192482B4|nr:desiccation-related protein PCC13-62-like [Hibiscus syriacus]
MATRSCLCIFTLLLVAFQSTMMNANTVLPSPRCSPVLASTREMFQYALNLHIYKAVLFLGSSVGRKINDISPDLVEGPAPIGVTLANLGNLPRRFIEESGLASVGHIRAIADIESLRTPLPMPQLDIRPQVFAKFFDVINVTQNPPFNTYANTNSFLFAAAYASYFLKQYYAGIIPSIVGNPEQELATEIALYEAASYGVIRSLLNDRENLAVPLYTFTVGNVTNLTAQIGNQLGGCGVKDEGLTVPLALGAENRTTNNVIPADVNSLSYKQTALEILRIVFITGNATKAGGIFPNGFVGTLYKRIVALKQS